LDTLWVGLDFRAPQGYRPIWGAPLAILVLLLSACQRPGDTQSPLVGITQPKSGVISQRALRVEGYALDDSGIQSVKAYGVQDTKAKGTELVTAANKGQKLVRFSFKIQAPESGQVEVKVAATDVGGQTRIVRLPLVLDARPPEIRIDRAALVTKEIEPAKKTTKPDGTVEEIPAKTQTVLQISGRVLDDTLVERVTIAYGNKFDPLSLPKDKEVGFFYEIPARRATVIAVDAAGNRSSVNTR